MLKPLARHTSRLLLTLCGLLLIVVAILTLIIRLSLPLVGSYKDEIAAGLGNYLHSPVDIGELRLRWNGRHPFLRAENVQVIGAGDERVSLDELLINLDVSASLWRATPIIEELTLSGAELAVVNEDGVISIRGIDRQARVVNRSSEKRVDSDDSTAAADRLESAAQTQSPSGNAKVTADRRGFNVLAWLFNARKVGLLDTTLTLVDEELGRDLVLENLNIRAENSNGNHQLRIDTSIPGELGQTLLAGVDVEGPVLDAARSAGKFYLRMEEFQLEAWLDLINTLGIAPMNVESALHLQSQIDSELWGEWRDGRLLNARNRFTISELAVAGQHDGTLLDRITGDLYLDYATQGLINVSVDELVLQAGQTTNAVDQATLEFTTRKGKPLKAWRAEASGEQLSLELLEPLATALARSNAGEASERPLWQGLQGSLNNWQLALKAAEGDAMPHIDLVAQVEDLAFPSGGLLPSLNGMSGPLAVVDSGGTLQLSANNPVLEWPRALEASLPLERADMTLVLNLADATARSIEGDVNLADDNVELNARWQLSLPPEDVPEITVNASYDVGDLARLKQWMPLRLLRSGTAWWLRRAFLGGAAEQGEFQLSARLDDLPFNESSGGFMSGSVMVRDGVLDVAPGWPLARGIDSRVTLDGLSLAASSQGPLELGAVAVRRLEATIPRLLRPTLLLNGAGHVANLQDALDFMQEGPLEPYLSTATRDLRARGKADMDVSLTLPLNPYKDPAFGVRGNVYLDGNDLHHRLTGLDFNNLRGAMAFDQRGIEVKNLRAALFGRAVRLRAETIDEGQGVSTRLSLTGRLEAGRVLKHFDMPIGDYYTGTSAWQGELRIPHAGSRPIELSLDSDMQGTSNRLPAPLYKASSALRPTHINARLAGDGSQQWRFAVQGLGELDWTESRYDTLPSMSARYGGGTPDPLGRPGVYLRGEIPSLDMDHWIWVVNDLVDREPSQQSVATGPLPIDIDLSVGELRIGRKALGRATFQLADQGQFLKLRLSNDAIAGEASVPREFLARDRGEGRQLDAYLSVLDRRALEAFLDTTETLWLPPAVAAANAASQIDPRELPRLKVGVAELRWDDVRIKNLELATRPGTQGLIVDALGFDYRGLSLAGTGYWRNLGVPGQQEAQSMVQQSQLDLKLQSSNFGQSFDAIGLRGVVGEGSGVVEARLGWSGAPQDFEIGNLRGRATVDLERGSILQVEPGGARLVGLVALESLPRRFELDFRDVTSDGLAFTTLKGSANISNGMAEVPLLQLVGPIGVVDVSGQSDLARRTLNQRVTVLPRVSAALPVIGLVTGGASGGIVTLVAGGFLKALGVDFDRLGLREYQVTGLWSAPQITSVDVVEPVSQRQ